MRIFRSLSRLSRSPSAVSIGNFDGVHAGHQAMLRRLVQEAQRRGLMSRVVTFEPHPRAFFAVQKQMNLQEPMPMPMPRPLPWRISLLRDKLAAIAQTGVDEVVVLPFRASLARLSAQAFVDEVLCEGLKTRLLMVGDDFHFGAGRTGNEALLAELAPHKGFELLPMPSWMVDGQRVSSSCVRQALRQGDCAQAARYLGRPYGLSARVGHGAKQGRQWGFPTLNLPLRGGPLVCEGVFVAQVYGLTPQALWAAASIGTRPTVCDNKRQILEAHVLDWPAHLGTEGGYGHLICVQLRHYLRPQQRYDNISALRGAIAQDVAQVRQFIQSTSLDSSTPLSDPPVHCPKKLL
jgi:riboflavin kinase/FMN adenylyltransferase